ncbi:MAG: hypothetical protein Q8O40_03325 [Chloroflexota bacterium]|nr:hypothetical protein [Chloroflexota bacterium]
MAPYPLMPNDYEPPGSLTGSDRLLYAIGMFFVRFAYLEVALTHTLAIMLTARSFGGSGGPWGDSWVETQLPEASPKAKGIEVAIEARFPDSNALPKELNDALAEIKSATKSTYRLIDLRNHLAHGIFNYALEVSPQGMIEHEDRFAAAKHARYELKWQVREVPPEELIGACKEMDEIGGRLLIAGARIYVEGREY